MDQLTPYQNELLVEHYNLMYYHVWEWHKKLPAQHFPFYEIEEVCLFALIRTATYFDPEKGKFSTILTKITNGKMINYIRNKNNPIRKGTVISIDAKIKLQQGVKITIMDMQGTDDQYSFIESDNIESAWKLMNEKEQQCVYLQFYENMNQRDIGKVIGCSQQNVGKRIRRGLGKMKKHLV